MHNNITIYFIFSTITNSQRFKFGCAVPENWQIVHWHLSQGINSDEFILYNLIGHRHDHMKRCTWSAFYTRPATNKNPITLKDAAELINGSPACAKAAVYGTAVDNSRNGVIVQWLHTACRCNKGSFLLFLSCLIHLNNTNYIF